jgi:hypothetical protein
MIVVILATLASLLGIAIAHGMGNWEKVKENWPDYRCNPMYMPVAGLIRPDVSGQENFVYCTNAFAEKIWAIVKAQITTYFGVLGDSLGQLASPLDAFRNIINIIRKFLFTFMAQTMSKAANSASVFVHYLAKIKDVMKRFVAQGYIGAFLVQVLVDFLWSFVTLFISIVKTFVFVLLAISFILALFNPVMLVLAIVLASLIAASGF